MHEKTEMIHYDFEWWQRLPCFGMLAAPLVCRSCWLMRGRKEEKHERRRRLECHCLRTAYDPSLSRDSP